MCLNASRTMYVTHFKINFERKEHGQNTRNSNLAAKARRMKTELGRKSFSAANVYNIIPILARQLDSGVLSRAHLLNDLHACI